LHSQFGFKRLLCCFALVSAGGARLTYGDSFKAPLFESGLLASGAKLFQHHFFYSGGIIPTLYKVGTSEAAHSFS
jgi:hypothetical protein